MRGGNLQTLLGMAIVLVLVWCAPASAVIIASGDGTGNTSAPPDDPGWDNVVNLSGLSGVYLGNGWVLTANHVGALDMIIGSDVFEPVPGSKVRLGAFADLALFQILRDPGLPDVVISASAPPPGTDVAMIGQGYSRGGETSACGQQGWWYVGPKTMRWGTNAVHENDVDVLIGGSLTHSISTRFDAGLPTPHEAQAVNGDSGGAVFVKNGPDWELAGIMFTVDSCEVELNLTVYSDVTYAAQLSSYIGEINAITSFPACNDGKDQDGDGLVDHPDDLGCDDPLDSFETSDALPCDDGIDNDGDGGVDLDPVTSADPGDETAPPAGEGDPGCGGHDWGTESPPCQDGIDNDGDGRMDYDAGLSANGYPDPAGPDPECVGAPWRGSETPLSCGLGVELALLLPPLIWMGRRRR